MFGQRSIQAIIKELQGARVDVRAYAWTALFGNFAARATAGAAVIYFTHRVFLLVEESCEFARLDSNERLARHVAWRKKHRYDDE